MPEAATQQTNGVAAPATPPPNAAPDAAAATPPTAEGAPAAEPAPDTKEGRFYAALRARESKLLKDKEHFGRERSEFESYKTRTTQELTKAQQAAALASQDPIRYLKEVHGWDDDRIAGRIINGGKPTALDTQAKQEQELAELRAWRESQEREKTSAQRQAQLEAAREDFARVAQDDKRWPLASAWKKDRLIARGEAIALQHAQGGVQLSDEDILDKLEEELGEIASITSKKTAAATSSAGSTAPPGKPGTDTQPAPTLTGGGAAEVAASKEIDILKMSPDELRAYTMHVLKEGRAKGLIID